MNPIAILTQKLEQAFGTPQLPERNRYILMLRAFAEFLRDLDYPNEWRRKIWELGLALGELDQGITPEILRPMPRTDGGRPSDEWKIWIVRSRAVLALEARLKSKMTHADAAKELKKRFPDLDAQPYVVGAELKTSLRNWQRKMGDIKRGDHLDLVAEQHEEARGALSGMQPVDAIAVADQFLQYALR
jgi:hypothetical protein